MQGNRVIKNASWIIAARIVQSVLTMLISMVTARYLGPSNFGLINYAISIAAFALPIMQLGINNVLVQEIVLEPEEEGKILGSTLCASLFMSGLCIAAILGFVAIVNPGEKETFVVCGLYSLCLFAQAIEQMYYWFQAKLLSKYTSLVALASYTIVTIYKLVLLITGQSVRWFALSYTFDDMIIGICELYFYHKFSTHKLQFDWTILKRLIRKSKYYILSGLMITIFAQTDRIMLKLLIDEAATGYYSAAVSCAGMTGFIFVAIIDSARPVIFESKGQGQGSFETNVTRLYSVITYFALLQCIGITLFAKPLIYLLYGAEFAPAVNALRLIVWYTTFAYFGSVRNIWMLAEGKQNLIWIIDLSGAIANVFINWMLIPRWGIMGASFASLVTQIFTNVIMGFILKPVRPNNYLMMRSIHPKYVLTMVNYLIQSRKSKE